MSNCLMPKSECAKYLSGRCEESKCILSEKYISDGCCAGCLHFLDIRFSVDNALSFDGICRKESKAIPHKNFGRCKMKKPIATK